jgi:hypothetical protein
VITDPYLPDNPIVFASAAFLETTGYTMDQVSETAPLLLLSLCSPEAFCASAHRCGLVAGSRPKLPLLAGSENRHSQGDEHHHYAACCRHPPPPPSCGHFFHFCVRSAGGHDSAGHPRGRRHVGVHSQLPSRRHNLLEPVLRCCPSGWQQVSATMLSRWGGCQLGCLFLLSRTRQRAI